MVQYIQDNLTGMDEALALADQSEIDETTRQTHLAREFGRWVKYARFSKDPEFKKRCAAEQQQIFVLMERRGRAK